VTETINVYYSPVGSFAGQTYYHQIIIYTDSAGNTYRAEAQPSIPQGNSSAAFVEGEVGLRLQGETPYGTIQGTAGPLKDTLPTYYTGTRINPSTH
jgi:hypothetical protein